MVNGIHLLLITQHQVLNILLSRAVAVVAEILAVAVALVDLEQHQDLQ
jgi:hypothetical protein